MTPYLLIAKRLCRPAPALVAAFVLTLVSPALADKLERRAAVQTVFTGAASCPLAVGDTKDTALARCYAAAKINLLDNAAESMEKSCARLTPQLTRADYRAVAAGLLTPEVESRDFVNTRDQAVIELKLRAVADPEKLAAKIKDIAANPELRAKLAASQKEVEQAEAKVKQAMAQSRQGVLAGQTDSADFPASPGTVEAGAQGAKSAQSATGDFSRAAAQRNRIVGQMAATAESAGANIRRGMSNDQVRSILGEPLTVKLGVVTGNFTCLGYGQVWVVLQDGLTACLRERLEYVKSYDSDCHCAGMLTSFVPFATNAQTAPTQRKGAKNAPQGAKTQGDGQTP